MNPPPTIWQQASKVCAKDLKQELVTRSATNSILLFAICTLVLVSFATSTGQVDDKVRVAVLWVILIFSAFSGLAHTFQSEEDAGTSLTLRSVAVAHAVIIGKLLVNLMLLGVIMIVVLPIFAIFMNLVVKDGLLFVGALVMGAISLAVSATTVAAILSKARGKGALFGALGFPILMPTLILSLHATNKAVSGLDPGQGWRSIIGLGAFTVIMVVATLALFPYVWEE